MSLRPLPPLQTHVHVRCSGDAGRFITSQILCLRHTRETSATEERELGRQVTGHEGPLSKGYVILYVFVWQYKECDSKHETERVCCSSFLLVNTNRSARRQTSSRGNTGMINKVHVMVQGDNRKPSVFTCLPLTTSHAAPVLPRREPAYRPLETLLLCRRFQLIFVLTDSAVTCLCA